jgi:rubrerythrin
MSLELGTLGAVIAFAIGLEDEAERFYTRASGEAQVDRARDAFRELALEAGKRKRDLERLRRESVLEMTLEPIHGLQPSAYALEEHNASSADLAEVVHQARELEDRTLRFLVDAADKVSVNEIRTAFVRLANGARRRVSWLEKLGLEAQ